MDKTLKEKFLAAKSYAEAKPILETRKVSASGHELTHTAFSIMEKQPKLAESFLKTVIREMEDDEEHEKKVSETGTSHQASSTTGLPDEGQEVKAPESAHEQYDKKDQMGVAINETYPYMPQQQMGQPPQMQPPMQPPMQQPPRPPMPQQQMQYTVQEAISRQVAPYFNKLVEAVKALDKKVQETQKANVTSLDMGDRLGGKGVHSTKSFIRETTGNQELDLNTVRRNIAQINDAMNSGIY